MSAPASTSARAPSPSTAAGGLLLVYTERGPSIPTSEFEEWYNNEHIPLRLALPGPLFLSCTRWLAADNKTPIHLALYDLSSPAAVLEPPYAALATARSARELNVLAKLELLDRRVYAPLPVTVRVPPNLNLKEGHAARAPGPYVSIVELTVKDSDDDAGALEAELNRWYDEEHVPMLAGVPGWVRTRRFVASRVLGVTGTSVDVLGPRDAPGKYLAVHEWESVDAFETEEFRRATSTPWRREVMGSGVVVKCERRVFKFFRGWGGCEV